MSKKVSIKKIVEYIMLSLFGGCIISGLGAGVCYYHELKAANLNLWIIILFVLSICYFSFNASDCEENWQLCEKSFLQFTRKVLFRVIKYGLGCQLCTCFWVMFIFNNFSLKFFTWDLFSVEILCISCGYVEAQLVGVIAYDKRNTGRAKKQEDLLAAEKNGCKSK